MAKLTIYESALEGKELVVRETTLPDLSKAIYDCKEVHGKYVTAYVNNVPVHVDDWHLFILEPCDHIRLVPQIHCGSGSIVGAIVGATIGFFVGGPWGAFYGAQIGFSLGTIVDMYMNPLLPEIPTIGDMSATDPNYSWAGASMVTQPDGPVTVLYGEYLVGGALIMQYVSSDGDKNYLHMLINFGEGPIEGFMKSDESGVCTHTSDTPYILINGQQYSSYTAIEWDYRLGTSYQTVIDGFHNTSTFYSDGRKVTHGTPVTYTTTGTTVEEFEVQATCSSLFAQDSSGNIIENTVEYQVHYSPAGEEDWTDAGATAITGKSKTTVYSYKKVSNLSAAQYDIKIVRNTQEYTSFKKSGDLYLTGVTETTYENIAYRSSALLALTIQATDQLQGSTPNVTALLRGRTVSVPKLTVSDVTQAYQDCYWDDGASTYKRTSDNAVCTDTGDWVTQWTKHPVWNARDFVLARRYGMGEYFDSTTFDDTTARTEAKHCWELVDDLNSGTEHRFEMNLPLSKVMSAPSALQVLAKTFRSWIIWSNGMLKPVIDRSRNPVQLFNQSNIKPRSLRTTYLPASKIPNLVELQYADPDRAYNIHTMEVADESEWTASKPLRKQTVSVKGVTRASQVLRDGKYYLQCGLNCTKIIEFSADMDAIHCEPGDKIQFQSDSLAWGAGGRVVSATSNTITTNIDITVGASTYYVRVRLSDGTIETKTVTTAAGTYRTLTISGTFTSVPLKDTVFTFGESTVDSKPFKVVNISRTAQQECQISAIEESDNKYIDTTGVYLPDPIYTDLPSPMELPDNVTDLVLSEMTNKPGFWVSFNIPQEDIRFHHADVHLSMDDDNWWPYRTNVTTNADIEVLGTKPGQTYYVKVIAYNSLGMANLVPETDSIEITEILFTPPDINGLRLDGEDEINVFTKRDAKFTWRKGSLTSGAGTTLAGQEVLGAGEWLDDVYYRYWVEIYVSDSQVRKEILTDNFYEYSYEKNVADNTTASNSFTIKVWGYNEQANIKSLHPATLAVTNPAPDTPTDLVAESWWEAIHFVWTRNSEIDFSYYYYRLKVETDAWSSWAETTDTQVPRKLTATEVTDHGNNATIYIELIAYDTFENYSTTNSVNGACAGLDIEATDIEDFAITAAKIFTKIPILSADSWTDDSPGAGSVAWNEHKLYYNGTAYTIAAGNTANKYIYWDGSSSSYSNSASNPTLTDGQFIIATNISGAHDLAWNAIANQVIGSAYIQNLAVTDAKINDLNASKINAGYLSADRIEAGSLDADKITANSLTATQIAADTITATLIAANTITANEMAANSVTATIINVSELSVIGNADLGTITAGIAKSSDDKLTIDFNNKWLKVWDAAATPVLRVHLGYIP